MLTALPRSVTVPLMNPVHPLHRLLIPTLSVLALIAGCDGGSNSAGDGGGATTAPSGGASAAAPAQVRLGYFANVTHGQAVLGVSSGDFASAVAPAKFSTKVFNAGPSLIEALFANEIDIGYVGPGPALAANARSKGEGVRIVSGAAANGVLIVARKDSGINSVADLAGKKIATPQQGNTQDIAARHYLVKQLKQPNANNIVPIPNAEQVAMMDRGQIDAAWAPEPWGSRLVAEAGAKIIAEEKDLWPNKEFSLTVIITTPEFLAKHPETVKQVLGVHARWTERLSTEPQKYAGDLETALVNLSGKKLPPGLMAESIRRVNFTNEPLESTFLTMGQWAHDLGFSPAAPDISKLFDTTLLKQVTSAAGTATTRPATRPTTAGVARAGAGAGTPVSAEQN